MVIFIWVVFLMFQMIFSFASFPMDAIDYTFALIADQLDQALPPGLVVRLTDQWHSTRTCRGVGFHSPDCFALHGPFLVRRSRLYGQVVYLLDHILIKFGLNGRSVMGLISGGACAIPAIMSTRSISNPRERLITSFVIPLIPCSARIPVYAALIGFIVPAQYYFGVVNLQGLVFMGLYFTGISMALITAFVYS
ncbi:MAG: ferrous iron transporter B [Saprospiraceae bacterium]|nr:ferrous iron transporter B [Candidatus Vicinibacter affinis]